MGHKHCQLLDSKGRGHFGSSGRNCGARKSILGTLTAHFIPTKVDSSLIEQCCGRKQTSAQTKITTPGLECQRKLEA